MAIINFNSISGITSITATGTIVAGSAFIKDKVVGLGTITTTERNSGVGTAVGSLIYNETLGVLEIYKRNSGWVAIGTAGDAASGPLGLTATGGVVSDYTDPGPGAVYRAHVFTSSGTFSVSSIGSYGSNVETLVVAGGGGGGVDTFPAHRGVGGGGAGGFRSATGIPVSTSPGSYTITVGAGGAGGQNVDSSAVTGVNGSQSIFNPSGVENSTKITSDGGGGGGGHSANNPSPNNFAGSAGGSGGGGANGMTFGAGNSPPTSPPQGNNGGAGSPNAGPTYTGGGGGGAGGAGTAGTTPQAGAGGAGSPNVYAYGPGNPVTYAGGGGGKGGSLPAPQSIGAGGPGGGGAGVASGTGNPGTYSTGGGGGATRGGVGGKGGSGIVVVRYQIGSLTAAAKATGGAISYYGGKTIHTFTTSGTFATAPNWDATNVEYVVIGGGGSGGSTYHAGGGGAGGYLDGTTPIGTHPVSVSIQVGAGAASPSVGPNVPGTQGTPSYFGVPITATGGGGGGSTNGGAGPGGPGGSGGGGSGFSGSGGSGTPGQGYAGGSGGPGPWSTSAGGGGAGGAGTNGSGPFPDGGAGPNAPTTAAGVGGLGRQVPATFRNPTSRVGASGPTGPVPGTNPGGDTSGLYWFAGGGGGNSGQYGGPGGGKPYPWTDSPINDSSFAGGGAGNKAQGGSGLQSTGGGGGGSERNYPVSQTTFSGGSGGSGIVIIAYPS